MRLVRSSAVAALAVFLLLGLAAAAGATPSATPRTYTVLVGAESAHRGVDVMAYFPSSLRIRVGDTVHWVQNSNEIHTVTFLGGGPPPDFVVPAASLGLPATPSPLVFAPMAVNRSLPPGGLGDTTTFVNSGLMGREAGQYRSFDLTFTRRGHVPLPLRHPRRDDVGQRDGRRRRTHVASPGQASARGHFQIARKMAKAPAVLREARRQIKPATGTPTAPGPTTWRWASTRGRSTSCASSPASCSSARGTRWCGRCGPPTRRRTP